MVQLDRQSSRHHDHPGHAGARARWRRAAMPRRMPRALGLSLRPWYSQHIRGTRIGSKAGTAGHPRTPRMPERQSIPPYVPWRTFENYLDGLREFGTSLPNVIDRDSMRTYSGATQSWLLSTLRSLNMIDEHGAPRPRLMQIVQASPDDRKPLYRQLIEAEYSFLDGIELRGATQRQLARAFESTGATGDTVRKCLAFFIGLAKAADLQLSPLIQKAGRRPKGGNGNKSKARGKTTVAAPKPPSPPGVDNASNGGIPHGFERMHIPGLRGSHIQFPSDLTEAHCDLFAGAIEFLRTTVQVRKKTEKGKYP